MPARKPSGLNVRHDTLDDIEQREAGENALKPKRGLPVLEPRELEGHPLAAKEWRRLMRMYNGLEADIVSRLDIGMLLDYVILLEQMSELDELRAAAMREWRTLQAVVDDLQGICDAEPELCDRKGLMQAAEAAGFAFEKIIKVDGRVDRKRSLLLSLRQSLYLTPRSRAGVTPNEKPKEAQRSDLDALLDG